MKADLFNAKGAAEVLFTARQNAAPCDPVAGPYGIETLEQTYAVQAELINQWGYDDQTQAGYKLGVTDTRVQEAMALEHPLFGHLLSGWDYMDGDTIPASRLITPKLEGEVAFLFRATLDDPELSEEALLDGLKGVLPALEICDSAFAGWPKSLFDAAADNLSSGLYVLGSELKDPRELDLANLEMKLYRNNDAAVTGHSRQCMGNPLTACLWLVRELARRGTPIRAGELILSGSLGPMVETKAGDKIRLEIGELGSLECRFS